MPTVEQIEQIKREGVALNVPQLAWQGYRAVTPDDHYRLKFQGVCAQRNVRSSAEGYFFLRIKIPYGQLKSAQLKVLAQLTNEYGRGMGHLTTRQGMELHSVRLEEVPSIFERLESVGLTTKASCGDTIRNVVTCPHVGDPNVSPVRRGNKLKAGDGPLFDVRPWAMLIQNHFLELGPDNLNLPRKMNVYMTSCPGCIGHARINDLGLVGSTRRLPDGQLEYGFALWVGGGLGANPVMGQQLKTFLRFDEVLPALEAVVRLYIDHGSRKTRAQSKLKFLVEEWGMGRFSQEFEKYYTQVQPRFNSRPLPRLPQLKTSSPARPTTTQTFDPATRHEVNVLVPEGEIPAKALERLAELCNFFGEGLLYFTKEQNIRFKNLSASEAEGLTAALQEAGFETVGAGRIDDVLACPGTDFCPVGATPSLETGQRIRQKLGELITANQLSPELQKMRIHISGCPNSCAQHQVADIGLSGTRVHAPTERFSGLGYQLFLGGNLEGTGRLGMLVHHGIPTEMVPEILVEVLTLYQNEKQPGEEFAGYVNRIGQDGWEDRLEELLAQQLDALKALAS